MDKRSRAAMKRKGHLLEQIVENENLRLAITRALRGKRHRPDAREFVGDQGPQAAGHL